VYLLLAVAGCATDLTVTDTEAVWDAETKMVQARVTNVGFWNAGAFLVYFNGDESPVSPNRRPQVTRTLYGLAAGDSVDLEVDFAPLAHPDNAMLSRVRRITVVVDPKDTVEEMNEDNNSDDVLVGGPLPDLVVEDIYQDGPDYLVVKYRNVGAADQGDFLVRLSAGDQSYGGNPLYRFPVPPPGEVQETGGVTISLIGLEQGSEADVTAEIDWEERVPETDEDNNTYTEHITIE
jgi:hypothetical protein